MSTATFETRKTDLSVETLEGILRQHHIDRRLWGAWKALVFYGTRPSRVLSCAWTHRFYNSPNYRQCFRAVVTEISTAYWDRIGIKWPPKNWRQPRKAA